jgi:S1-C subfamily serine protease
MRLASVLVAALLLTPAVNWNIEKVAPSLARLTVEDGPQLCTAFLIKERPARWATMTHCLPPDELAVRLNGTLALTRILAAQPGDTGILVFETGTPTWKVKALPLGDAPRRGDEVLQIGYGGGAPVPLFYAGLFITAGMRLQGTPLQFNSAQGMPGMSGGPLVDRKYRAVGVVSGGVQPAQAVPTLVSYSPPYADLKAIYAEFGR